MKIQKADLRCLMANVSKDKRSLSKIFIEDGNAVSTNSRTLYTCKIIGNVTPGSFYLDVNDALAAIKKSLILVDVDQYLTAATDAYPQWELLLDRNPKLIINGIVSSELQKAIKSRNMPNIEFSFCSPEINWFRHFYGDVPLDVTDKLTFRTDYDGAAVSARFSCKLFALSKAVDFNQIQLYGFNNQAVLANDQGSKFLIMPIS